MLRFLCHFGLHHWSILVDGAPYCNRCYRPKQRNIIG